MKKREFENIDQLFKQELDLSGVKAPASVKANIDAQLGRKRKRLWFFLIPALLIAGIAIPLSIDYIKTDSEKPEVETTLVTNDNDAEPITSTSDNVISNESTDYKVSENNLTSDGNNTYFSDIEPSTNADPSRPNNTANQSNYTSSDHYSTSNDNSNTNRNSSSNINSNTDRNVNTDSNSSSHSDLNSSSDSSNESSDNSMDSSSDNDQANTKLSANTENSENNDIDNTVDMSPDSTNSNESAIEDTSDSVINEETDLSTDNANATSMDSVQTDNNQESDIATVDQDSSTTESISIDSSADETNEPDHNIDPPEDKYRGWFITLNGGPKFKRSNLSTGDTSLVYNNALNDRAGFGIGVDVNYRLKKGFVFGSGLTYASYSENYDYQKTQVSFVDSTVTYVPFIYDSIPDSVGWIYLYDTLENVTYNYDTTTLYNQQGQNKTTYLHIPFRIGGQFIVDKWRFDAYAQGRFNLLLQSNATYVINDQLLTSTLKQSYFDLELGGAAHYNVWKNLYLSGVIRYRPSLRNPYYDPTIQNRMQYLYIGFGASINL